MRPYGSNLGKREERSLCQSYKIDFPVVRKNDWNRYVSKPPKFVIVGIFICSILTGLS